MIMRLSQMVCIIAMLFSLGFSLGEAKPTTRASNPNFSVLYNFQQNTTHDGAGPLAGLTYLGGTLYGTTYAGGDISECPGNYNGCGTIFSVDAATGKEKVLHALHGSTEGNAPHGGLLAVHARLYGTAEQGGAHGKGTLYSFDLASHVFQVLHAFSGGASDASSPTGDLIATSSAQLVGTSLHGGTYGLGTLFAISPSTGNVRVLHSFGGPGDGSAPTGGPVLVNGTVYGTTRSGGSGNCEGGCGTIFSFDRKNGEKILYSFTGSTQNDGNRPNGNLIDIQGTLYGTTEHGGAWGEGSVFSYVIGAKNDTVLYSFVGDEGGLADGAYPEGGLVELGGTLYGTTYGGGAPYDDTCGQAFGCGTIFSVPMSVGSDTILESFRSVSTGQWPQARLIASSGVLYGTACCGGENGTGVVFALPIVGPNRK